MDDTRNALTTTTPAHNGIALRQTLPVASPEATRATVKVLALAHPPKIGAEMKWAEWYDLATASIGCHPEVVLRRAVEIALARQKYPSISVNDMVMAILAAYRDLGVVLSPDARKLSALVNPPTTSL